MKVYKANKGIVELCLTYRCNVKCDNCSNLCTQAPFSGDLTADIVQRFLEQSEKDGHVFGMITLHGGEPVLNPEILSIVKILKDYSIKTGCKLWLLTNNSSPAVRRLTTKILADFNIPLGVSTKRGKNITGDGNPIEYVSVNVSPSDIGEEYEMGCFQTENCGICFNYLGYFPCSPIAAAARVFGYKGCDSINNLTDEKCQEYFNIHCKHCGFSVPSRKRVIEQNTSKTWDEAFKTYNSSRKDQA